MLRLCKTKHNKRYLLHWNAAARILLISITHTRARAYKCIASNNIGNKYQNNGAESQRYIWKERRRKKQSAQSEIL